MKTQDIETGNINEKKITSLINKINICYIICLFMCSLPIIITDLYFGFSNEYCLTEQMPSLNFNLKTYLISSAFVSLIYIVIYIISSFTILCIDENEENILYLLVINAGINVVGPFINIIINILGGVLFWSYIYPNNKCSTNLSTYLFVSIILKIISHSTVIKNNNID
jgi:hypothetical protein